MAPTALSGEVTDPFEVYNGTEGIKCGPFRVEGEYRQSRKLIPPKGSFKRNDGDLGGSTDPMGRRSRASATL